MFGVFQPRTDRPAVEATRSFLYTNTTNPPLAGPGTWPMNLQEPVSLLLKLWEAPSLRMEHIPGRWMSYLLVSKHRVVKVMRGLQSKLCACRCSGNSLCILEVPYWNAVRDTPWIYSVYSWEFCPFK